MPGRFLICWKVVVTNSPPVAAGGRAARSVRSSATELATIGTRRAFKVPTYMNGEIEIAQGESADILFSICFASSLRSWNLSKVE